MSRIFRFAMQAPYFRLSERWTFFWNAAKDDLYATTSRMKGFGKISFHESGACHLKTTNKRGTELIHTDHTWQHAIPEPGRPAHIMRIIYPLSRLNAKLNIDKRIPYIFENLDEGINGNFAVNFDIYKSISEENRINETSVTVFLKRMTDVCIFATATPGPAPNDLPISQEGQMNMYLGTAKFDDAGDLLGYEKAFATFLAIPESEGPIIVSEVSWDFFDVSRFRNAD